MKRFFLFISYVFFIQILVAKSFTISGYVLDAKSGETLLSASVFDSVTGKGTITNSYGFYSLTLPEGKVSINFSYVGYLYEVDEFVLSKDTIISVSLNSSNELEELTVLGKYKETNILKTQIGSIEMPVTQMKSIPALLGESDVLKALQLLPGVQGGIEGSAGLYVRGGGPDQNLLLLDGVPVYNVNHMFGFFSVFNTDAIKNVTLYKGSFPARFGSRLSSVVDIRMNDGNLYEYHGKISIGLLSSKFLFEGPLIKGRTSFNLSARRTYIDFLTKPITKKLATEFNSDVNNAGYYFYDLNLKINHKINNRNKLILSAYTGDDAINAKSDIDHGVKINDNNVKTEFERNMRMDWDWGNFLAALRWNSILNNKLFMNTTVSYTRYRFLLNMNSSYREFNSSLNDYAYKLKYDSGIDDITTKIDFDFMPSTRHDIKFGTNIIFYNFKPGVTSYIESTVDLPISQSESESLITSYEADFYIEDNIGITDYLKANIGLHASSFLVQKKTYHSLQPRISSHLLFSDKVSFKAAYSMMTQYIHLLSNNNINLPTDLWVPVTKQIVPMVSNQYSVGVFYDPQKMIDFSIEGYYKSMNNIIEYKDGASFWGSVTDWQNKISTGRGWSYGIEFLAQKPFGKTTGWISYTWSKSERLFDQPNNELNFGKVFPAKYDRRNDLNIVLSHKFSKKFDISSTWVFSSGNVGTLETHSYESMPVPNNNLYEIDSYLPYVSKRNGFKYPDYHRMDIGFNYHFFGKKGVGTWNLSIYNLYNQLNPFMIYVNTEFLDSVNDKKKLKKVTILPILPSIGYSYKF